MKLILFAALAATLLLITIFAKDICPYDPYCTGSVPGHAAAQCDSSDGNRYLWSGYAVPRTDGAQTSISSTFALVAIITVFGTIVGIFCGYYGGVVDSVMMRISDICLAFPGLVFAMAVAAILNGGVQNAVIALALISWPKYSRIARSQTLSIKELPYIQASRLAGDTAIQMIFRHVLPNIIGPVLVTSMLDIGTMMMEIAGLSFLGLGAQPPVAEWGSMMSSGRSMLQTYPWIVLSPGAAIFVSVVIFNLLGDTIRDYMDPRNSRSR